MLVEDHTNYAPGCSGLAAQVDRRSLIQRLAALNAGDIELAVLLYRPATLHERPRVTQIRREAAQQGQVSTQITYFKKPGRCAIPGKRASAMALDGIAAFRARFDHNLAISAEVEAERQRVELELKRVPQEQVAEQVREWHR
jgi:hypothetical protein